MWAGSDRIQRVALDPAAFGLDFWIWADPFTHVSEVKGYGAGNYPIKYSLTHSSVTSSSDYFLKSARGALMRLQAYASKSGCEGAPPHKTSWPT